MDRRTALKGLVLGSVPGTVNAGKFGWFDDDPEPTKDLHLDPKPFKPKETLLDAELRQLRESLNTVKPVEYELVTQEFY
jgi:hypothetical protein